MTQRPLPTASGALLTPAALVKIFEEELRSGPIPTEAHLAELASMTVFVDTDVTDGATPDFVRDIGAPLYREFCCAVDDAKKALDILLSQIPGSDWEKIVQRTKGLKALQGALEETAPFLQPSPQAQSKRGAPNKQDEHITAWGIAEATQSALQAAGHKGQISITSDNGPVSRIGARILAIMLGCNVISSATFADWVGKHLGGYPRLTQ